MQNDERQQSRLLEPAILSAVVKHCGSLKTLGRLSRLCKATAKAINKQDRYDVGKAVCGARYWKDPKGRMKVSEHVKTQFAPWYAYISSSRILLGETYEEESNVRVVQVRRNDAEKLIAYKTLLIAEGKNKYFQMPAPYRRHLRLDTITEIDAKRFERDFAEQERHELWDTLQGNRQEMEDFPLTDPNSMGEFPDTNVKAVFKVHERAFVVLFYSRDMETMLCFGDLHTKTLYASSLATISESVLPASNMLFSAGEFFFMSRHGDAYYTSLAVRKHVLPMDHPEARGGWTWSID